MEHEDFTCDAGNLLRSTPGTQASTIAAGARIFCEGDPADSTYYIVNGRVKLSVVSTGGKEAILGLPGTGHFFGEGCLTGQRQRTFRAETLSDCTIVRTPLDGMRRLLAIDPSFSAHFLALVIARNERMSEDLADHMFNRSEKRLARALLLLAGFDETNLPQPRTGPVNIGNIKQETLAEMIGTTRSRVSSFMNKFRRLGFIRYRGEIEVDISLLNVVRND